ncbi:hypothetical protein K503DRAFT_785926, partial [Rhizopogon vinicolor AM-OR11-026]
MLEVDGTYRRVFSGAGIEECKKTGMGDEGDSAETRMKRDVCNNIIPKLAATFMASKHLLKMLVAFTKRLKFLKLSVRYLWFAFRPVLELFRRLLHGISHKLSWFPLPEPGLSIGSGIMGATQPMQNVFPVFQPDPLSNEKATGKTLAVRPFENLVANTISSQHGIRGSLTFSTMPMLNHIPNSSAAPNVTGRGQISLRAIVASEIRRYKRAITHPSSHDNNWLRLTHPEGARYFFNPLE